MAQITMPKMSDTMEEGKVIKWLKHEGDPVNEGEPIAEIETDKANVEMEAFEGGVVSRILVTEGETVPVGEPIAEVQAPETAGPPQARPEEAPVAEHPAVPETKAPEPYATEQAPGVTTPKAPTPEIREEAPVPERWEAPPEEERMKASPLARRMAEERGIDLSQVQGAGPGGRITEADVEKALQAQARPAPAPAPAPTPAPAPVPPRAEVPSEEQELSRMRRTIAERMTRSKQTIPHFYVTTEVEMDWASRVRDELNQENDQPKVSFTDMIVKACALALRKHPMVNASFAGDKMLMHNEVNIGIAVALEDGLIVPVVHNADKLPIREIAQETRRLAQAARENKLHAGDLMGATFTVSNLGMFEVESFSAIINPPESASVAVGKIMDIPVVINEQVAVSQRMKMTISADHRILDGAVAARFLQEVKHKLESPISLL